MFEYDEDNPPEVEDVESYVDSLVAQLKRAIEEQVRTGEPGEEVSLTMDRDTAFRYVGILSFVLSVHIDNEQLKAELEDLESELENYRLGNIPE